MRSSLLVLSVVSAIAVSAAPATHIDLNDPRRTVGRQDDVRVDAELSSDTLSPGSHLTVTYLIENLGRQTVAIADKVADMDYDPDSRTITISIGAEIPTGTTIPHMVTIRSGEKRVLTSGTFARVALPRVQTPVTAIPRYVQIKITLLRDVVPFASLIERQATPGLTVPLPAEMFDRWVESSDSVFLNAIPVRWNLDVRPGTAEARAPSSRSF